MLVATDHPASPTAPTRSSLDEFAGPDLAVVRTCLFSYPAKILTPAHDILVPLLTRQALPDLLARDGVSGVIATPALAPDVPESLGLAISDDPLRAHHRIHSALARMPGRLWARFATEIDKSAHVHPTAWISPHDVRIGPGVIVMPHAVICERSAIGEGTRIHANAVVGGDAYEIVIIEGQQELRPQTGGVRIGSRCEILAGSVITRSAFCGSTVIGDHSVLDCNVTVSHDCRIGANVRIGGSSWLGGRVTVGDTASIGPNSTIGNGLSIGDRARLSLGSVVTRDVPADGHVSGNFAIEHAKMVEHLRRIR